MLVSEKQEISLSCAFSGLNIAISGREHLTIKITTLVFRVSLNVTRLIAL